MPPRSRRRLTPKDPDSTKNQVIWILLFIVMVESLLLFKVYQRKRPIVKEIPHRVATTVAPRLSPTIKSRTAVTSPLVPAERTVERPVERPSLGYQGKIAIIIDDSGYNLDDCHNLASLTEPVTISILPNLEHSTDIAQCAHRIHKDVMLHLPLEPYVFKESYPRGYYITTTMSADAVMKRFREALASVPFAVGINNHTGSKATEDERLMSIIFAQLKERNMFFVDSLVTGKSICRSLAARKGMPFAERDVFLDNENRRDYIEQQFGLLVQEARKKGFAVAIGHTRPLTWQIVKEQTEKLGREGFELVPVEEIIKK